jgi:monoamine oxidase
MMLNRRQFIQSAAFSVFSLYTLPKLAAGALLSKSYSERKLPQFARGGRNRKVIILGGGITGLCAAYELIQAGFEIVLLELTRRTGGRILTLRNYFGNQSVELGATRIPDSHFLTIEYAKKFGLTLDQFPLETSDNIYYLNRAKIKSKKSKLSDYSKYLHLHPHEALMNAAELREYYTRQEYEKIGNPRNSNWPDQSVLEKFDPISLNENFLQNSGASEDAVKVMRSYNGSETDDYNSLLWLGQEHLDQNWNKTYGIQGGNDQLPDAFAQAVRPQIVFGAKVVKIKNQENSVQVTGIKNGEQFEIRGDYVISTIPIPLMRGILFEPALSDLKQRAIHEIEMQSVTRIDLQFKRRFWNQEEGLNGLLVACSDTPIERLWDLTSLQKGPEGVLASYVQNKNSRKLQELGDQSKILEFALNQIRPFFPQAEQEFFKGNVWQWKKQPWVKGAWAAFDRNQTHLFQALQIPHGRVFFAGDHTSLYNGWIQGALESAHLAVSEVIGSCL